MEHRTVKIDCQVDIEEADVTWYFEGIEIIKGYPDWFDKIKMVDEGRERMLIIEDVPREAQGLFECKTNSDETQMKLRVAPVNEFLKPLEDQTCSEKEQVTFECQMVDDEADAEWRIAGDVVQEDDRIQIKKLDKGVHRLIILRARIKDTGDVSCTCVGQNETKAQLLVNKAEVVAEAEDQDANDGKVKAKAKGRNLQGLSKVLADDRHSDHQPHLTSGSVLFCFCIKSRHWSAGHLTTCPADSRIIRVVPPSCSPRAWREAHGQDQGQEGRGRPEVRLRTDGGR